MHDPRGELEVETLLKIVLALLAVLLTLQIIGTVVSWIARLLTPVLLLIVASIIVLWLYDRL